jgi:hypothetical protein
MDNTVDLPQPECPIKQTNFPRDAQQFLIDDGPSSGR